MSGRKFNRPRTKMYDCNYNLGESYYRSALDGLDRKYGKLPAETIEPPRRLERPLSFAGEDLESYLEDRKREAAHALKEELEEEKSRQRLSRARAREAPSTEAEFENAFHQRREEVKKRFSEKMLDTVGINGTNLEEESLHLRRRAQRAAQMADEEKIKLPVARWTALDNVDQDAIDEFAAKSRARMSRARLADIDNEMEEIAQRGAQRERRLANLRELLTGDSSELDSAASASIRMKKTVITTTTEKRAI